MSVLVGSGADLFGVSVDGTQEAEYVAKVLALNPTAYWILGEHEGSVAYCRINPNQNGTHANVALGNAGVGGRADVPLVRWGQQLYHCLHRYARLDVQRQ